MPYDKNRLSHLQSKFESWVTIKKKLRLNWRKDEKKLNSIQKKLSKNIFDSIFLDLSLSISELIEIQPITLSVWKLSWHLWSACTGLTQTLVNAWNKYRRSKVLSPKPSLVFIAATNGIFLVLSNWVTAVFATAPTHIRKDFVDLPHSIARRYLIEISRLSYRLE